MTTASLQPEMPVDFQLKVSTAFSKMCWPRCRKRFYAPEKLNGDWQAAVERHRPTIRVRAYRRCI